MKNINSRYIVYSRCTRNRNVRSLNISNVLVLFILLIFTSACDTLLEENPKKVAESTFYNTLQEAETALNAIYLPIGHYVHNGEIGVNSVLGEFTYGRGSWAVLNNYEGLNDTWITRVSGRWEDLYLAIRNANIVIKNLPDAESMNQDEIDECVAEAKFLRAFCYFQLVKNWGGVPIRTDENIMEVDVVRASDLDVYNLIEADLVVAENDLPDDPRLIGTPSKWAAKTLLADVYLSQENYSESSSKAQEVINSDTYSLVSVSNTDDFQNIFGPDVITTSEEIFYSKYSHETDQGNVWPGLMAHPATGLYGKSGVYGVYSLTTNLVYQNWDDNDLRKGQWFAWNIGVGSNSLLSKKFIDPDTPGLTGGANPITWYRYADLLMIYAEASNWVNNGPTQSAMEAVNQIHRRAYGYNPESPSEVDFSLADYDRDSFNDLILLERGYEFDLEGKRWYDLKRTGKAEEIISNILGKSVAEKLYLWPIPVNEFNFNLALDPSTDQNSGY